MKDGGPAFPRPLSKLSSEEIESAQDGISHRDYLAAKAMQGLLANPSVVAPNAMTGWGLVNMTFEQFGQLCYDVADCLLLADFHFPHAVPELRTGATNAPTGEGYIAGCESNC